MADKKKAAAWAAGVVLLAAVAVGAWWAGKQSGGGGGEPPASELVGSADPFTLLECRTRLFDESLALAVTFSQPLDRRQSLGKLLQVVDLGAASGDDEAAKTQGKPQPGQALPEGKPVAGEWSLGDNPRVAYFPYIQPNRRYAIAVPESVKGAGGQALPEAFGCEVASEAMPPSFYFASRGVVLPAGQNGGLPVVTVNTPEVDVQFLRIDPAQFPRFFEQVLGVRRPVAKTDPDAEDESDEDDEWRYSGNRSLKGTVGSWDLDRLKDVTRSVYAGRFLTDDKANRRHVTFLPVEGIKELKDPGIYVAVMSQPGRFRDEYQVTYFYVSDIGLHTRRYAGQLDAFATSLKSGKAMDDVEFELLDANAKSLGRAKADGQGRAVFTGSFEAARILLARRGAELSVVALAEPALDLSEFDVGGYPSRDNKLFVYAGRDLYRPGERFDVSVLVRDADGRAVQAAPITATLKRPDGRTVRTALWRPDAQVPGYVREAIELPADAQTGTWLLETRLDPAARAADASWKFQVEEFLPERMKLDLKSREGVLEAGRPLNVKVQGDYLYGAPAAGNRLLGTVSIERDRYALPRQWPGFLFGDFADDDRKQRRDLEETTLDDKGAAAVAVPVDVSGTASPMKVKASFSLLESGGRPVVRSIERSVWPAPSLIGVRPLFDRDVAREGTMAEFEAVRVDPQGKVVPLKQAQLRVYREERVYYWRFDDQRGWNSGFTETEELVESRVLALPDRVKFGVPVKWGRYRLELSDPEHGDTLRYRFYAGWGAQDAEEMGNRPDRVQLKLDHAPVREGETVKLSITPPHDGEALIAVEGGTMLWSQRTSVKASGSTVEIPVGKDWSRHDLYVSVTVFRPGSQGDRVTPARALGLAYLPLSRDDRRLAVELAAPAKVLPEKRTTVKVKVGNAGQGQQAYVTLSAVDVGILNITRYATPDPFDFFFGKHRYAPELLDLYGKLIEKMEGTQGKLKWGGDAAMRDTRSMPVKVRLVDLFSGPVRLDEQGEAQIPLDLPDFNGTLRLMASAFTPDRFGNAQAEMVVAAPVVAELSTPRFISPGDEAAIALDVTNLSGAPQTLTVNLEGLDPVRIRGGSQSVSLANQQRTTLRFVAEATGAYGLGRLRLTVDGQGGANPIRIVRESLLQVQPPVAATRDVRRVRLGQGESLKLESSWIAKLYPDSASASVAISNKPPFNVKRLVQGLLDYPYGCLEQTASAAYPHVFIGEDEARAWGLTPRTRAERERMIEGAVGRIAGMQKAGGGFALWGDGAQEIWLSAYVTGFLQDARTAGFNVPDLVSRRASDWLLSQLQQSSANFPSLPQNLLAQLAAGPGQRLRDNDYNLLRDSHRRFAELANAAYVLAREQKAPLSTLRVLYDNYRDRSRSPLPLVHLGIALKLMGDETRARSAFDEAMTRGYGIDVNRYGGYGEWLGDYGSALRDYAMSYALMMQHQIDHPRREALLGDVAGRLGSRSYLSTQEQLALFLAARAAGGVAGAQWTARLRTAQGEQQLSSRDTEARSFTAAQLAGGVDIVNTQADPLFVEVDVQGYPRQAEAPRASGVTIARSWYESDGRPWNGRPLQTGEMLIVKLDVASDRRIEDALVVDRVPAGLEVENMNLSQGPDMADWKVGGVQVSEALNDTRIKHREYRDDRYVAAVAIQGPVTVFYRVRVVTPGRFVVPAPVVEDMYRPEIRAVGASSGPLVISDPRGGAR
ncbi:alpha-2-macroglobulin [Pigmentiphaga sp. NML030171]|uniref:alpha-2-macroglobulin family protein n=1 Tax=unclassified Pigmentiphaga TaxID=2626614 RepID=UPI000B4109E5|nr:alpha-2-macroglobulin [Pigmentiphaga sp. NML030171]OVZ62290.1 alpha-2-macroglobulin [Pigmentiphaga sp. NML030171]